MSDARTPEQKVVTRDDSLRLVARGISKRLLALQEEANARYLGRTVRFVSKFNGQPYGGRSRKPLTGKETIITAVYLDERRGVTFHSSKPEWINAGFDLNDVEFV